MGLLTDSFGWSLAILEKACTDLNSLSMHLGHCTFQISANTACLSIGFLRQVFQFGILGVLLCSLLVGIA